MNSAANPILWAKILNKGLITLPKSFRDDLSLKEGEFVKVKKIGRSLVIEPRSDPEYELYSDAELAQMLKADKLPAKLAKKAASYWVDLD